MFTRAHIRTASTGRASRGSLRGLGAIGTKPFCAPPDVALAAGGIFLFMASGLEHCALGTARAAVGRLPAAAAEAIGPPLGVLLAVDGATNIAARLTGRAARDEGPAAATRAKPGIVAGMKALLAFPPRDPATHLRIFASVEFTGGLSLHVAGALGLAPLRTAWIAQAAVGREFLLTALRAQALGLALYGLLLVALPLARAFLRGIRVPLLAGGSSFRVAYSRGLSTFLCAWLT